MKQLSVVIVTWNQRNKLKDCLESIFNNKYQNDYINNVEVIVVDNSSTDSTLTMLENYNNKIQLIKKGKYIMMLDDDTEVLDDCFIKIINFMNANKDCWCLGTKQLHPDGSLEFNARTFYDFMTILARRTPLGRILKNKVRKHLMIDWDHESTRIVDWVAGASFVMRRKAIDAFGSFDENYFFGFEDTDWCYQVKKHKKKVYYLHDAKIIHHIQGSSRKLFSKKAFSHLLSAIRFYKKNILFA